LQNRKRLGHEKLLELLVDSSMFPAVRQTRTWMRNI
jgi:hypothetical protein